jgi:hypothetical protein
LEIIGPIQAVGPDHVVMLTGERIAVPADLLEKAKIVVGLLATISVEEVDGQLVASDYPTARRPAHALTGRATHPRSSPGRSTLTR